MQQHGFHQAVRSALLDALVENPRALALAKPQGNTVGTPQGLPGLIPFGSAPPGMEQSSRFTGGNVPSPLSLTRGETPPDFQPPVYGPPGVAQPASPLIAALAGSAAAAPSGATSGGNPLAPPPGPPHPLPTPGPPALTGQGSGSGSGSSLGPGGGSPQYPGQPLPGEQTPQLIPYGGPPPQAVLAALAQLGKKINPSGGAHFE